MESARDPRFRGAAGRYALLAALFVLAGGYQVRALADVVRILRGEPVRQPVVLDPLDGRVIRAEPEAEAAGVHAGDRVLAVQGAPFHGRKTIAGALPPARPGDTLDLTIARPGEGERTAPIRLAVVGDSGKRQTGRAGGMGLVIAATIVALRLLSVGLGFAVAALRPRDGRAWLLLMMMASFAQIQGVTGMDEASWGSLREVAIAYDTLMSATWPIWMMLFGIYFPERLAFDARHPRVKWLLIVPIGVLAILETVSGVAAADGLRAGGPAMALLRAAGRLPFYLTIPAVGSFFTALGVKSGQASTSDARRRLKLVYWGAAVGLTPAFLLLIATIVTKRGDSVAPPWLLVAALVSLLAFPLSLAYAIVVERALDVRVVVRQGLQYALARRGVMVLQVLVILAVIVAASTLAGGATTNRPRRIQYIATGIAIVFLMQRAADRLRGWIDRRFFREAYDAEQILTTLSEDVRTIVETDRLLSTVGRSISSSLHVPHVRVLVRHDGRYVSAYAMGDGPAMDLAADSPLVMRLREARQPLQVDLADAQLLLPLAFKDDLLGILCLGPKQSEEPYSPSDVRLLQSVASQTAIALENSQLTAAVARETGLRARMSREIEIAREVQEGLFPQHYPPVLGIEYVGYCRPAQGVGGDYYDFVKAGDGLGIAIGDISGKGIPAALLMATLQASLRAQAISAPTDLAALMGRLNSLIYEASPANRYATFFYSQYDPVTRRLTYVNAGHNAPVLIRPRDGEVDLLRLEGGGPVVGLLPTAEYVQCALDLRARDLLVGFTDGLSEALSVGDEEWGEERLIHEASACLELHPSEAVERIVTAVDAFSSGAPQHDDMTLVVLRMLP
jgi:sigma-B regulation protein RsbU (phosphoserine phosphatase)